ncbi:MAG: PIN domain-containing protein [Actinomycetia bacterium]|nr:PIN domain-containing protein [Actinomycetes bacterium]
MKPLFVDTSGWYDLMFSGSPQHEALVKLARRPEARFVTSTYVLDELVSLVLVRSGYPTAARAGSQIRSAAEVTVEHPDAAEELRAWKLFLERPDKTYTLTDCLSFVMMRRLKIDTAVATDEHFRQEGFTTLPV